MANFKLIGHVTRLKILRIELRINIRAAKNLHLRNYLIQTQHGETLSEGALQFSCTCVFTRFFMNNSYYKITSIEEISRENAEA